MTERRFHISCFSGRSVHAVHSVGITQVMPGVVHGDLRRISALIIKRLGRLISTCVKSGPLTGEQLQLRAGRGKIQQGPK